MSRKEWTLLVCILLLVLACGSSSKIATINIREDELFAQLNEEGEVANGTKFDVIIEDLKITDEYLLLQVVLEFDDGRFVPGKIKYLVLNEGGKLIINTISTEFKNFQIEEEWIEKLSSNLEKSVNDLLNEYGKEMIINDSEMFEGRMLIRIEILPTPSPVME